MKRSRKPPRARRLSLVRWLALTLLVASAALAVAASPTTISSTIRTIATMQAPRMLDDVLLLTFRSLEAVRFVGARFERENWRILHAYARNENGVFVLEYPVPEGMDVLRYRIVVDGLWMADPSNPERGFDDSGVELSVFRVEEEPVRPVANPTLQAPTGTSEGAATAYAGQMATFIWRGTPGGRVAIVGDFNGWNPFDPDSLLAETKPGEYRISITLQPGPHYYCFFAEGRKFLDPRNARTAIDPDGRRVNAFVVPYAE